MKQYVTIYHFYQSARMRLVRLLICLFLLGLILFDLFNGFYIKGPLFLFNIFVMVEVFFHYKIAKAMPAATLSSQKPKDIFDAFTMQALSGFVTEKKTPHLIQKLLLYPQVDRFLQKTDIDHKELPLVDIDKKVLAQSAFDTAVIFKGKYVTTLDIFAAYLFLIEHEKKLLFAKQLKTEDIYNILYWMRLQYPEEESPKKLRAHFEGGGIGEELSSGWTPETKKYTAQFTASVLKNEPYIRGREEEFRALLEGLIKIENNNVLLVGDIGSGKENLVRALAYHSFAGNLGGGALNYKKVLQVLVGTLIAGASGRSELEERLQNIIAEVSHADDVILYMPEFQNLLGSSSYGIDLSGALLPYLKSGIMPIVATMTTGAYKKYLEQNPLKEAFNIVLLKEPEKNTAIQMVLADSETVEKKYKVILSYRAITTAVELANRFFQDEVLPGSAVLLLENVANEVALSDRPYFEDTHRKMVVYDDVVKKIEKTINVAVGAPTEEEINLLMHLEEKLHERVIGQDDAIKSLSEAMRRIRSGIATAERPISFLFLGPTGVGKTETAKALADLYFGGQKNIIRLDMSEYTDESGLKRLLGSLPGEGDERGELTDKIHDNPASLVLLDEFEKANPKIHNLFLQVLDDGRLTDNKGRTVSFRNAIIIATSNVASEFIREEVEKGTVINKKFQHNLLEYMQSKGLFKPELLNRFDDIITFKPLADVQVQQVVKLILDSLQKNLAEQDITLVYDDAVVEKIVKEGFDREFGARPLRRYVQDTIEDMIAQKKLSKALDRGKTATLSINGVGALELSVS